MKLGRTVGVILIAVPSLALSQPKSAIQFYDTTGAEPTLRMGWRGGLADGEFYLSSPVGSDLLTIRQGTVTVDGAVSATSFSGDAGGLTNVPEPDEQGRQIDFLSQQSQADGSATRIGGNF